MTTNISYLLIHKSKCFDTFLNDSQTVSKGYQKRLKKFGISRVKYLLFSFLAVAWLRWISSLHFRNNLHRQPCQEGFQFHVHRFYVFYVRFRTCLRLFIRRLLTFTPCGYIFIRYFYYAQYR